MALRRLALPLSLAAALLAPAASAQAVTFPKVSKVTPSAAGIGESLTITGTGFRKGKGKNTVVFKRDGGRAIFVRAGSATTKKLTVKLPAKLLPALAQRKGQPVLTRFRVRVISGRFGRTYTPLKRSPRISPVPLHVKAAADDCDGDGLRNAADPDDDNDLLHDTDEGRLKTDLCKADSDGDGMSDGWEMESAKDRNNKALPSPASRPYPNALDGKDALIDHDGDGLTNAEEYAAWATSSGVYRADRANDAHYSRLTYSGGNPNSDGRGAAPPAPATHGGRYYADRDGNGYLTDFERDADRDGIPNMDEERRYGVAGDLVQVGRLSLGAIEYRDFGLFSQVYLELIKKELDDKRCSGINQIPFYCLHEVVDVQKVDTLDWLAADTDGDGVRDDADDVDHDDVPNLTEMLDELGAAPADRSYRQLDACIPSTDSRFCLLGTVDIDRDGKASNVDEDDDGDLLADTLEKSVRLDPLRADTDGDLISDGFEYYSAVDLNSAAVPYPGKRPYPNALDAEDAGKDFDGDGLTLTDEFQAWVVTGAPLPLSYSDGLQRTGGTPQTDDLKDVDADGLGNFVEAHGPLSGPEWWDAWITEPGVKCGQSYVESTYPGPAYKGTSFTDPDTDGDGILDGIDDQDFDDFWNVEEVVRGPQSADKDGNPLVARNGLWVQPFNPCLPAINARTCPAKLPLTGEIWSPFRSPDATEDPKPRWPLYGDALYGTEVWAAPNGEPTPLPPAEQGHPGPEVAHPLPRL